MKKISIITAAILFLLCSCNEKQKPYSNAQRGVLAISSISVDVDVENTKAGSGQVDDYTIIIKDSNEQECYHASWADFVKEGGKLTLLAGNYSMSISSIDGEVPYAAKESPVYGINESFAIAANQTTDLGALVCKLLQCMVTVDYSEDFLSALTGDCKSSVSITSAYPLDFNIDYNGGSPVYDRSAGYFAVAPDGTSSMVVVFSGSVNGKNVKMTKVFTDIKAATWRQVKFINKINDEGNADFIISIDDFVEDSELVNDLMAMERILGPDPDAPKGDGGIKLESTCAYDITKDIIVPSADAFVLTMKATIPNKVSKFTVEISSDNKDFEDAVKLINDGNTTLDLVNPSEGAKSVFTTILPFPYGENVRDKESIDFNLSDAQAPLLVFAGRHSFIMHVMDKQGCKKDVSVVLVVE